MTPDIREKAERLAMEFIAANGPSYLEDQPWCQELASAISKALLEAHKAGREEAAQWLEDEAELSEGQATWSTLRDLATAIRSLP